MHAPNKLVMAQFLLGQRRKQEARRVLAGITEKKGKTGSPSLYETIRCLLRVFNASHEGKAKHLQAIQLQSLK